MTKKIIVLLVMVSMGLSGFSRSRNQLGLYLGTSFYQGDLNESRIFTNVHPAIGGLLKINITKRYALKMGLIYNQLSGSGYPFNQDTVYSYRTFSGSYINFGGQFEINMFPYLPHSTKDRTAPYIFGGLGYTAALSGGPSFVHIPFGVGIKHNLTKRLSVDVEWSFRKTFNDKIDGVENFNNPYQGSLTFNNDWYYLFGLVFTYKFFNIAEDCPVYKKD